MASKNNFELTNEEKEKINMSRKVSTMKTLIFNHCYGVPDTLKFGLTEGWTLTKHFLILVDSEEGFNTLKTAFEDIFINFHLNTIDSNENSGIGINEDLFSGKLTDDDIQYIPELKKYSKSKTVALFKFHKQSIVITTDPKEIFARYDGNKCLTVNDIGFFTLRPNTNDFIAMLSDYNSFIKLAEDKNLKDQDLLEWLYRNIIDGRFLYKPNLTLTQEYQQKLTNFVNSKDMYNKNIPSMEDVVNNVHKKVFESMAVPIDELNMIEADYVVENDKNENLENSIENDSSVNKP